MSKLNRHLSAVPVPAQMTGVVTSTLSEGESPASASFERDAKSELFLLAVTNLVGEQTFYESAGDRDSRYVELVRHVTDLDPSWVAQMLDWLRSTANMRTASLVGAVEYARAVNARFGASPTYLGPSETPRAVVRSVLKRADEPGELLAYWLRRYGRRISMPVKRGVADAVTALYTEQNVIKWDSSRAAVRFADVVELCHPDPIGPRQSELFRYLLEERHGRATFTGKSLPRLEMNRIVSADPDKAEARRRLLAEPELLEAAGMTWESLSGLGKMDAEAWEAVIPRMGYMALLRNLRNFDEAGVSRPVLDAVGARLRSPAEVARSRQLPMRFLSAYNAVRSDRWRPTVDDALECSLRSLPRLSGDWAILVDTSGSMGAPFSRDGTLMRWDAAAVFGLAAARAAERARVWAFSNAALEFPLQPGENLLASVKRFHDGGYMLGRGTATQLAVQTARVTYPQATRFLVLTDEQANFYSYQGDVFHSIRRSDVAYTFNLAGYERGHAESGTRNRHVVGGLSDQAFQMLACLEDHAAGRWPWES